MKKQIAVIPSVFSILCALTLAGLAGCGRQLAPSMPAHEEPAFSSVLNEIQKISPQEEFAVVVGITTPPTRLFAWDINEGRVLWSTEVNALSAPVVAGQYVVVAEEKQIVVRRIDTGDEVIRLGKDTQLLGADSRDDYTAIALRRNSGHKGTAKSSGLLMVLKGSSVSWKRDFDLQLGVPAVAAGMVFVPWATHRISVIDAAQEVERTRFITNGTVASRALVDGKSVYVGGNRLLRLTPSIKSDTSEDAAIFEPLERDLPGQPPLLENGYEPVPPPDGARHRIRLIWKPKGQGDDVSLEDDNLYLLFYRFVFALSPKTDEVWWVYQHPVDMVGAVAQPGGLMLMAEDGKLFFLSAKTGQPLWEKESELAIQVARIRPGTVAPEGAPKTPPRALSNRLFKAARLDDNRLASGRAFAVRHLARFEDAAVTGQLIAICSDMRSPQPTRSAGCNALKQRTKGARHLREALSLQASFLTQTAPPPSGTLALAAAHMGTKGLTPLALKHLFDPATPSAELPGIVEGLKALGGAKVGASIEKFLLLYHAEKGDSKLEASLLIAADALALQRKKAAIPTLKFIAYDPMTQTSIRSGALNALKSLDTPTRTKQPEKKPAKPTAEEKPEKITAEQAGKLFARVDKKLRPCLTTAVPSARITMVVTPEGAIQSIRVSPLSLQQCIEPILSRVRFPGTGRIDNQQVAHVLRHPKKAKRKKGKKKGKKAK